MNEHDLPDLRILPTEALVLHEETDPDRTARLVQRLREEGRLKNPPIVAAIPDSARWVVLDGANRVTSLRAMAIPHTLVQVVEYDTVTLDTWNHVVTGMGSEQLFAQIRRVPGLTLVPDTLPHARALLTARRCLGYLVCPDGDVHVMRGGRTLREEAALLNGVVHAYKGIGKIYRIKTDVVDTGDPSLEPVAAVLVFPRFSPADIITLAASEDKMPTGITRHIIPLRALRLNYDLARLADPTESLEAKSTALGAFLQVHLQERRIRLYPESTVLFDE